MELDLDIGLFPAVVTAKHKGIQKNQCMHIRSVVLNR